METSEAFEGIYLSIRNCFLKTQFLVLGLIFITLTSCSPNQSTGSVGIDKTNSNNNSISQSKDKKQKTNKFSKDASTPKLLKKGTSYAYVRKYLIDSGWIAPKLPKGGYKESDAKVVSECDGSVKLCNRLPEIDSCSGANEGYCNMYFENKYGKKLKVITKGGLEDGAILDSWELQ